MVKELQQDYSRIMGMLDEESVLQTTEVLSSMIGKLIEEEKLEEMYKFSLKYDLDMEKLKENIPSLMEFYDRF